MKTKKILIPLVLTTLISPWVATISCSSSDVDQNLINSKGKEISNRKYPKSVAEQRFASSIISLETFNSAFINHKLTNISNEIKIIITKLEADDENGDLTVWFAYEKNGKKYYSFEIKKENGKEEKIDYDWFKISGFKTRSNKEYSANCDDFVFSYRQLKKLKFNSDTRQAVNNAKTKEEFEAIFDFTDKQSDKYIAKLFEKQPEFKNGISFASFCLIKSNFSDSKKEISFKVLLQRKDKNNKIISFVPKTISDPSVALNYITITF